jgi:hypothetical protein
VAAREVVAVASEAASEHFGMEVVEVGLSYFGGVWDPEPNYSARNLAAHPTWTGAHPNPVDAMLSTRRSPFGNAFEMWPSAMMDPFQGWGGDTMQSMQEQCPCLKEDENHYRITVAAPGIAPNDIQVTMDRGVLRAPLMPQRICSAPALLRAHRAPARPRTRLRIPPRAAAPRCQRRDQVQPRWLGLPPTVGRAG